MVSQSVIKEDSSPCSRRSSIALNNGLNNSNNNTQGSSNGHYQPQYKINKPIEALEVYTEPVDEEPMTTDRSSGSWRTQRVLLTRVPGYGFGIAVSGGRDNPHFANGDPAIAVSDVLRCGPAEDVLQVNDRIISANGISLENVEYATAVQVLRESGDTVSLLVKRRGNPATIGEVANTGNDATDSTIPAAIRRASMSPAGMSQTTGSVSHHARSQSYGSPAASPPPLVQNSIQQQGIKISLTKAGKKDDFGIVLGCRLFIKDLSAKAREQLALSGQTLQEGDIITRIHNTSCADSMGLKEARKIMEGCKERLSLVVTRNNNTNSLSNGTALVNGNSGSGLLTPSTPQNNLSATRNSSYSHAAQNSHCSMDDTLLSSGPSYSAQNLYVVPPTRPNTMPASLNDDKSNLLPRGRSRNPLLDVSLSQLDRPSTPQGTGHSRSRSAVEEPPRPPPPRAEDYYSSRKQLFEDDSLNLRNKQSTAEPRYITFMKDPGGSVGIRLTGGNECGVFVAAVQSGSAAFQRGLEPGDRLLRVNDVDMRGVTREEAVLLLLGLQDRVDLIVKRCKEEYDRAIANQKGDNFHVKAHFHYTEPLKGESGFRSGDVFRVLDTLHNGVVGSWQVLRVGRNNQEMQKAVIPNKARAEELATAQFNATKKELSASESRGNFFRRRRSSHRRSKSLSREHWDDVVFSDSVSKFPAYERVVLRHPGFMRPVVLFGAVADLARDRLLKDFPDKFTAPQLDNNLSEELTRGPKAGGIIRLSGIRDIMDRGRHALLDITPNAVDRLNYAQFYPIVIYLKADSKHTIKQHRQGIAKSAHKSSKKLLEQSQKLERVWSHTFSGQVTLGEPDSWYRKLRDLIDQLQSAPVWASESKPEESLSDDFLFPMTSRLSYASSPESDLELSPGAAPRLVKASSDPSVATAQDNGDRDDLNLADALPPPYSSPYDHSNHVRRSADSKYGFSTSGSGENNPGYPRGANNTQNSQQNLYGPDLPPRIDRAVKPPSLTRSATSAQDRLFGGSIANSIPKDQNIPTADEINGYHQHQPHQRPTANSQNQLSSGSLDRNQQQNNTAASSLDRSRPGIREAPAGGNGSYDSVSSYDSYSNTLVRDPLGASTTRLGPNAPDDLKSVPQSNKQFDVQMSPRNSTAPDGRVRDEIAINQVRSAPYHPHDPSMQHNNNSNMRTGQLSPRPMPPNYQDTRSGQYQDSRGGQYQTHDPYRFTRSTAQPVINDGRRLPPQSLETKTDYGKYSQAADYKHSPSKSSGPAPPLSPVGMGGPPGGGYKPVPPPKPKNYRPPVPGWSGEETAPAVNKGYAQNGHSHNGDVIPRSPNGYGPNGNYYGGGGNPPNAGGWPQMHPNHHQTPPGPPHGHQQGQGYGYPPMQHYAQRSPHGMPNQHMGDGRGHHGPPLDLAGSREQRGSAFELYRKPQAISHHHNIR